MSLELNVRARHHYEADAPNTRRDVYLHKIDGGAVSPFLWHVDCPIPRVRELVAWAEGLGIPVVQEPPGNLADGWTFPPEQPPAPKLDPAEGSFD